MPTMVTMSKFNRWGASGPIIMNVCTQTYLVANYHTSKTSVYLSIFPAFIRSLQTRLWKYLVCISWIRSVSWSWLTYTTHILYFWMSTHDNIKDKAVTNLTHPEAGPVCHMADDWGLRPAGEWGCRHYTRVYFPCQYHTLEQWGPLSSLLAPWRTKFLLYCWRHEDHPGVMMIKIKEKLIIISENRNTAQRTWTTANRILQQVCGDLKYSTQLSTEN